MKDIIIDVARFIPGFLQTLLYLSIKPYTTISRVVRDGDFPNACLYFFVCVVLTQLFRFRMFNDFEQIIKIGAVDIGWKIIAGLLVIIYLWAITLISKEPDLTRLSIFIGFIFGTFSILFQLSLILARSIIAVIAVYMFLTALTANDMFGECIGQIGNYTSPRIIDTEKCKELISEHRYLVGDVVLAILPLIPILLLWLLWVYKVLRAYIDNFLTGKRRWLGILVLIVSFPVLLSVILNIRGAFLEHTIKM